MARTSDGPTDHRTTWQNVRAAARVREARGDRPAAGRDEAAEAELAPGEARQQVDRRLPDDPVRQRLEQPLLRHRPQEAHRVERLGRGAQLRARTEAR